MTAEPGVWVEGPDGELVPDYESTFPEINECEVVHGLNIAHGGPMTASEPEARAVEATINYVARGSFINRRTPLLHDESRSLSFSAFEIIIFLLPSIRYMGAESW